MKPTNDRYTTPRRHEPHAQPSCDAYTRAHVELMARIAADEAWWRERVGHALAEAEAEARLSLAGQLPPTPPGEFSKLELLNSIFVLELLRLAIERARPGREPTVEPFIENIAGGPAFPGNTLYIAGIGFGAAQGSVFLVLKGGIEIELIVDAWSEVAIRVHPAESLSGLRPDPEAFIYVVTSDRRLSNDFVRGFQPALSMWSGRTAWLEPNHCFLFVCLGHTNIYLKGPTQSPDADFMVVSAGVRTEGGGHVEKVEPHAGGASWAQGILVRVSGYGLVTVHVMFTIRGPRGLPPPNLGWSPWEQIL